MAAAAPNTAPASSYWDEYERSLDTDVREVCKECGWEAHVAYSIEDGEPSYIALHQISGAWLSGERMECPICGEWIGFADIEADIERKLIGAAAAERYEYAADAREFNR